MRIKSSVVLNEERNNLLFCCELLLFPVFEDEASPAADILSLFTPAGDPKTWQNKSLPGDPNYLVGANCVSVLIDHFWRGRQLACYWMW